MFFTVGDGDTSKAGDLVAAAAPIMKDAGASYVRGSVALTGEMTGKGIVSSIWDSIDAYYEHRHLWITDPGVVAAMEAAGSVPLMTNVGQILDERGDCDGPYTVAVQQTATDHSLETTKRIMDVVEGNLLGNGVNGARAVRGLAAGQGTGTYLGIFYVDSLDAYAGGIQGLYVNADFQAAAASSGLTVVERSFSRKV
tara:strand:- start:472 stop:1062 length:591 start_codon:yes stop_codon:yes gene_type:complete